MREEESRLMPRWHENLNDAKFVQTLEAFTEWPSGLDHEIPVEPVLTTQARDIPVHQALILQGQVIGDTLVLSAPPGVCMPDKVRDVEIRLSNLHVFVSLAPSTI
jgi:hypothetical protein